MDLKKLPKIMGLGTQMKIGETLDGTKTPEKRGNRYAHKSRNWDSLSNLVFGLSLKVTRDKFW